MIKEQLDSLHYISTPRKTNFVPKYDIESDKMVYCIGGGNSAFILSNVYMCDIYWLQLGINKRSWL
jgi:hypothetical protein